MNTLRHPPSCLSLLPGPPAACLPSLIWRFDQHQCACPASSLYRLLVWQRSCRWLSKHLSTLSVSLLPCILCGWQMLGLHQSLHLWDLVSQFPVEEPNENRSRLGASGCAGPVGYHKVRHCSLDVDLLVEDVAALLSAVIRGLAVPLWHLNTRRFQRLEYCCWSFCSFCIFLICCSCAWSIYFSESFSFFNLSIFFSPSLLFSASVSNTLPSSFSIFYLWMFVWATAVHASFHWYHPLLLNGPVVCSYH